MTSDIERVAEALRAFERGEIVVVTDDDDREGEGDLIVAAVHATPEKVAFIVRHTSGIVCAPMTRADARRLNLAPMVAENDSAHTTAFTVSIDYRHGTTTGISADDRAATVRALANPNAAAEDFSRPGHIFPLIARDGGVLVRSGHTEAAVDLCRLAGLPPIGVICELVNDDGTVTRGPQVTAFAEAHGLKKVSVADLIAWRQRNERLVERVAEFPIDTPVGTVRAVEYRTPFDPMHHVALVFGDIRHGTGIPTRLKLESVIDDVFGKEREIERSLAQMAQHGCGVFVYLREGAVGVGRDIARPREGVSEAQEHHESANQRAGEWREVGIGAQILKDLGISSIKVVSSRPRRYLGLEGFGLKVEDWAPKA